MTGFGDPGADEVVRPFVITSESSVASGVRRIEALTGTAAIARMIGQQQVVESVGRDLKVSWTDLHGQVRSLQERIRQQEREIAKLRGKLAGERTGDMPLPRHQRSAVHRSAGNRRHANAPELSPQPPYGLEVSA